MARPTPACPTCGKTLRTEQGMRQHHAAVHGESLPNRTCEGCGADFYDAKARREFCDECNPNAGAHNGNQKGGTETATYECCGASFSYSPSSKRGVYCSPCIEVADGLLPDNPSEKGDRETVSCGFCEADLEVRPARLETRTRGFFCDLECYGEQLSANVVGPDHHQWEGGSIEYGRGWWRVRRRALERDGYECRHCGVTADKLGRHPDIHHVRPVRSFDRPANAHAMDDVVTLCRSCHRRAEAGTIDVSPRDEK